MQILAVILVVVVCAVGYEAFSHWREVQLGRTSTSDRSLDAQPIGPSASTTPSLSEDGKRITLDGAVLLDIDSDAIYNWFKTESQLCDGYNQTSTPDRKAFCEDKASFRSMTRFAAVAVSPDAMKIGFTIESDTLSPDTVVGIFLRSTGNIHFLTNYYLGNKFLSFSPHGTSFAYRGGCFEGMCGLFIMDSETVSLKLGLNTPESADSRVADATFVRWISDSEVEYKLGTELSQESF